jgi:two-component system cell cycle sensor histidine kinase/response regulator CckA
MGSPSAHEVIIVVEDEEGVRTVFARSLRSLGYTVLEAENGEQALQVMSEHAAPVHLVMSDINMPEMDGLEFMSLVRSAYPSLPGLLVSGESPQFLMENRDRAPEGVHFLAKPVTIAGLANKVRQIIDASA